MHFFKFEFMRNAMVALVLITPMFGILGTMVVNHKMAFFSDALGHSAFTGVAIGIIFGIQDTSLTSIVFAIVFALLLNAIRHKGTVSSDTVISVFSSLSIAVGLAILSKNRSFSKYSSLLVGDILSVTKKDLIILGGIFVATLLFWIFEYNNLQSIGIHPGIARTKGIKIRMVDNAFVVLMALIVMLSIKWVGTLIINALLILPAASARNISSNSREYHLYSVIISMVSGIFGLIISYYLDVAVGPIIAIIASIIFFSSFLIGKGLKAQ